jgi:DNA-binding transcriptional MerR regulator
MDSKLISAREITVKYHITYQTVNHYTNLGLLRVVVKRGNVRMYGRAKVKHSLAKITQLMNEGYPLRLIKKYL